MWFLQAHLLLAAADAQTGQLDNAGSHTSVILRARPSFSAERWRDHIVYIRDEDRDHLVDGLRKAGLPE